MKKLFALFILATAALTAAPGSYNLLTFSLTVNRQVTTRTAMADGGETTTLKAASSKITNATILSEAQRLGLLPAGSLAGWKLVSFTDDIGTDSVACAYNPTLNRAVPLLGILAVDNGLAAIGTGTFRTSATGKPVSGSLSAEGVVGAVLKIGAVKYEIFGHYTETYAVKTNAAGKRYIATTSSICHSVLGAGNGRFVSGKVTVGTSVPVLNLDSINP